MHPEILSPEQQELLPLVKRFKDRFGLVGGTAIALYLGHRRSIDFDLFTSKTFDVKKIRSMIRQKQKIEHTFIEQDGEFTILANQVRMTFYHYRYPIRFTQSFQDVIQLPDLVTLGAMKVFALGQRAKWKDYVDLYFLFKQAPFASIVKKAEALFGGEFNQKLLRTQLSYFADIDYSEEIKFMEGFEVSPAKVQRYLRNLSLQ